MYDDNSIRLGVNVDHIATIRQVRGTKYPDPVRAALAAEEAGADQITVHLREDRRHIQERDVKVLKEVLQISLNLEMAATKEMVEFAKMVRPDYVCLVPEKREELTTEGGLDVVGHFDQIKAMVSELENVGIQTSLFIDPSHKQIEVAYETGSRIIEIHTGAFADSRNSIESKEHLVQIQTAAEFADNMGFSVHAGHGLHYQNVQAIAAIMQIKELNIGHSIVAEAFNVGMQQAVQEMKYLMEMVRS